MIACTCSPFLRRHNRLMAALDHFPLVTGDNVISVGADALLVCPKDQMCALIKEGFRRIWLILAPPQE